MSMEYYRFNPLDRGNLYQIDDTSAISWLDTLFQSPRSGKFVSDKINDVSISDMPKAFQSPRSGKFVSDWNGLSALPYS